MNLTQHPRVGDLHQDTAQPKAKQFPVSFLGVGVQVLLNQHRVRDLNQDAAQPTQNKQHPWSPD